MKTIKNILLCAMIATTFTACDDLFEPAVENYRDKDEMYDEPPFALGILLNGYTRIPTDGYRFSDVATDDAVSNDENNAYRKMALGGWTSDNNPMSMWSCYTGIQYMNTMLEEVDAVKWNKDSDLNRMFADRTRGEALALRGMFMYYLLRAHSGPDAQNNMLGVPIYLTSQDATSNHNVARSSFQECVEQIISDFDEASTLLPLDFENATVVPEKYQGVELGNYNRVFGYYNRQRITTRIIEGLRSRLALLVASPSFNTSGDIEKWSAAAEAAQTVIDRIGGIAGLAQNGITWYANTSEIDNLADGANPAEILWRTGYSNSNSLESDNFPPTLYGNGRVNPTQNLVDAFPMANGYPIGDSRSGYNSSYPYKGRDPRLALYINCDSSRVGPNNQMIRTIGTTSSDAVNRTESSTRTGYYLRKLLRQDVNLNPLYNTQQRHYVAHMRYTEMFLNYAEAANEAYGPREVGTAVYSAYDVIKALRQRAGITGEDTYLEECAESKSAMRELIRNERRIELCFEDFRFWDLRRWKVGMGKLNETARGVNLSGGVKVFRDVERRSYENFMYYGPLPYSEVLKYSNLKQNAGW